MNLIGQQSQYQAISKNILQNNIVQCKKIYLYNQQKVLHIKHLFYQNKSCKYKFSAKYLKTLFRTTTSHLYVIQNYTQVNKIFSEKRI